MLMAKQSLYGNIAKKRARIASGSGETMRKPGSKGAPTDDSFKKAAKTAKKMRKGGFAVRGQGATMSGKRKSCKIA
jgi:hypothetical protein|tara:strand:+ start:502 stop:729 length:228 start_codon:yes stop_codon:yes gene_type:complete